MKPINMNITFKEWWRKQGRFMNKSPEELAKAAWQMSGAVGELRATSKIITTAANNGTLKFDTGDALEGDT